MASLNFPALRTGDPIQEGSFWVFPLFSEGDQEVAYRLPELRLKEATITEVSEAGAVPQLVVENHSESLLLLLEGQELIGAKQNRVLNTTVLIKPKSKVTIPVSCVEAGRWHFRSREMEEARHFVPNELRYELKRGVYRSLKSKLGHRSDQGRVWDAVAYLRRGLGVISPTDALDAVYVAYEEELEEFRKDIDYVKGATGLAIAIDGRVRSLDLFGTTQICSRVWPRLVAGLAIEALRAAPSQAKVTSEDVLKYWANITQWPWEAVTTVGEGQEYRAESQQGDQGSALFYDQKLVYLSAVRPVVSGD